jgi:hypothetical protein
MPYAQMDFSIVLYNTILFSIDSCEFLPINQYILLTLSPKCLRLLHICFSQLSCSSRCMPRYLTSCGI